MIRQPAPKKFSCKPEAIWRGNRREIRSSIPEAIRPNQTISMSREILIRRAVGLRPTKLTLSQQANRAKAKRRSIAESAERSLACALGWKALTECLPTQGRVPAIARRKQNDAAGDCRHLLASRTGTCTCTWHTRAGFCIVAMSQNLCRWTQ